MNIRKITSLTALLSFLVLLLNSVVLYIVPQGRVSNWADWRLWGLDKTAWINQHIIIGVLFLAASFLHIYFNWKPMENLKKAGITFENENQNLLAIAKLNRMSPQQVYAVMNPAKETEKVAVKPQMPETPTGLGRMTLAEVCQKYGIDPAGAIEKLSAKGIKAKSDDKLKTLAAAYKLNPTEIYEIMK